MQCEIIGENLECILLLPTKYRTNVEGLVGNYNGDPSDDLVTRGTDRPVAILTVDNSAALVNDRDILSACLSCAFDPCPIIERRVPSSLFQGG